MARMVAASKARAVLDTVEPMARAKGQAVSVHDLDRLQECGRKLARAVDGLDRTHLRALADRYGLAGFTNEPSMRVALKRRLVGAHGNVRSDRK